MPALDQPSSPEAAETDADKLLEPSRPQAIEQKRLLLVEGPDDRRFLEALLADLNLPDPIEIRPYYGLGNLERYLKTLPATAGFVQVESLGVVRDADENAHDAFEFVRNKLRSAKLSVPDQVMSAVGGNPNVSIFIWPDGKSPGTLETLCLTSVRDDKATMCVEEYFDCLKNQMDTLPKTIHKAKLHTFLASREKPGLRIGEAAEKSYWDWIHPAFDPIKQFLRAL
jgi:hypothetical protein